MNQKPVLNARATATAQQQPTYSVTTLPKHLELFAQAVADGCNVREAAKASGRKENSGGYLNSRADVIRRVAELRTVMAKAAEAEAATKIVAVQRVIEIDQNDIIMGLADIARYGKSESARVSAWNCLSEIFLLKAKTLQDVNNFYGWTADELRDYAIGGKVPERLKSLVDQK